MLRSTLPLHKPIHSLLVLTIRVHLLTIVIGIIAHALLESFDVSSELLFSPRCNSTLDHILRPFVIPFVSWDGIHFLQIAEHGYHHEKSFAFFPFYPMTIRYVSNVIRHGWTSLAIVVNVDLSPFELCNTTGLALIGIAISFCSRLIAVYSLFHLSRRYYTVSFSYLACLFFILTPASIFYSAVYTESIFACAAFLTLWAVSCNSFIPSLISLFVSASIRSNGLILGLFPILANLQRIIRTLKDSQLKPSTRNATCCWVALKIILYTCVASFPSLYIAYYVSSKYCPKDSVANQIGQQFLQSDESVMALPHVYDTPPYCESMIPSVYSYIQSQYWNVGLFRYYEMRQIPNFLLAFPVWAISILGLLEYGKEVFVTWRKQGLCYLLADPTTKDPIPRCAFSLHWAFMTAISITILHVQVSTRFLSSIPLLYWYMASKCSAKQSPDDHTITDKARNKLSLYPYLWLLWWSLYTVLGSILFSTFLPFT